MYHMGIWHRIFVPSLIVLAINHMEIVMMLMGRIEATMPIISKVESTVSPAVDSVLLTVL